MDEIAALSQKCRVAKPSDTVVHSECAFTFFTPFSNERGILVNLHTFAGTVPELASTSTCSDGKEIFVRIVKKRVANEISHDEAPTKLAIGVQGGFATDEDKYQVITNHSVVVLDGSGQVLVEKPYDEASKSLFPEAVVASVESVIHHAGIAVQQDLTAWQDDEEIPVTKYFDALPFVDNGVTISPDPKHWKCQKSGATENLWLNLSDGYIGGGRKNWDGSGGSNGALDHFIDTGEKYPLVVKLGTITTEGSAVHADCFSYAHDENGPVKIPKARYSGCDVGEDRKIHC
jgi:ubiquitin carboxyl-terminal hydrolase 5/13